MFRFRRISYLIRPLASQTTIPIRSKGHCASKQAIVMKKLISGRTKNKGFWFREREPKPVMGKNLSMTHREAKGASRRVVVLNNLFMRYVTDIMATGEVSEVILGRGVEITRVKVSMDFQFLSVFWMVTDSKQNDESVENILKQSAGRLRHELTQLKLIGEVPRIVFVKDEQYSQLNEVDRLLAIADFGDDHEPNLPGRNVSNEWTPKFRTTNLDGNEDLPMRHDVFGLDHGIIMNRIKDSMSKSRKAANNRDGLIQRAELAPSELGYVTAEMADRAFDEVKLNNELLQEFLMKKKLERKKQFKAAKALMSYEHDERHADESDERNMYKEEDDHEEDYYEESYDPYYDEEKYDS